MMSARIYDGLRAMDAKGEKAREAARLGFLEWTFALDNVDDAPEEARVALDLLSEDNRPSPAAEAFLGYLDQTANLNMSRPLRRGGRRRVLN